MKYSEAQEKEWSEIQAIMHGVVDMTVFYYGEDPKGRRSYDPIKLNAAGLPVCLYRGPGGNRCGFSLCCKDELLHLLEEARPAVTIVNRIIAKEMPNVLKDEYARILIPKFWSGIQQLHDFSQYWNIEGKGLTEQGKAFVAELHEWIDGEPDKWDFKKIYFANKE